MTEQEEIEELRYLVKLHCSWCIDCRYEKIPETGLLEVTEHRPNSEGEFETYEENATCPFAKYWDRLATDEMWRSSPCHTCPGCGTGVSQSTWERRRAAEHWTAVVNRAYPEWECGYKGWVEKHRKMEEFKNENL